MTSLPLTVLYDADCGFCNRTALVLRRLDRRRRLRLVPLQAAASRLPTPSQEQLLASMHVVDAEGRWVAGGEAITNQA
jgi:predicted DCC family thiol-disulfide oxidoreductase YuxK